MFYLLVSLLWLSLAVQVIDWKDSLLLMMLTLLTVWSVTVVLC